MSHLDPYFKQVDSLQQDFVRRWREVVAIPGAGSEDARRADVVKMNHWLGDQIRAFVSNAELTKTGKVPGREHLDLPPHLFEDHQELKVPLERPSDTTSQYDTVAEKKAQSSWKTTLSQHFDKIEALFIRFDEMVQGNALQQHGKHELRQRSLVETYVIPGVLEDRNVIDATGDYCAKKNFMTSPCADRLGLAIDRKSISSVLTGSGKMMKTVGSTIARFRFRDDPEIYTLRFDIVSDCIHDLILGKPFLKATRTFSSTINRARRVITRLAYKITQHAVFFLGDSAPRFQGNVNGLPQTALADSGCKVLLMDEDYAEQLGLPILRDDEQCVRLVFADNLTAMTLGMVKGVIWSFGTSAQEQEYTLDFYVLKNAPAPVILSDKLLFRTDAYSRYECYLEDEDDESEEAYFLAIDIDSTYQHEATSNSGANDQLLELVRRGEEADRIAALPISEREQASLEELQRQTEWDMHRLRPPAHPHPPAPALNRPQHASTSTPPKSWKTRWRLKLRPEQT